MNKLFGEIFTEVEKAETREQKIAILKQNKSLALMQFLKIYVDDTVVFDLPEGAPPYRENDRPDGMTESSLQLEIRRLYPMFKTSGLKPIQKELRFISTLEALAPVDAKLLIQLKDKEIPSISRKMIEEEFPELKQVDIPRGEQKIIHPY